MVRMVYKTLPAGVLVPYVHIQDEKQWQSMAYCKGHWVKTWQRCLVSILKLT